MPDAATDDFNLSPPAGQWLLPLDEGSPCGPDLEYDPDFLELVRAAGKPESQFGPGEPANWPRVLELAESLLGRTRDLRLALWWGRAKLRLEGFGALPVVLGLLDGLLERFWDGLHPVPDPDDENAMARLSVIGGLDKTDSLLGDVREASLSGDPRLGGLRVRDIEVALSRLAPRADETPRTEGQVAGMIAQSEQAAELLRQQTGAALASLARLRAVIGERFRTDLQVDVKTLSNMLTGLQSLLPAVAVVADTEADSATVEAAPVASPTRKGSGVHAIETRQDAIRAIELVCSYLERHEPTNPAQLLLRRAARVIDKSFLELVQELAPDAVKDVARIMGVDPSTIPDQN